MAPCRNDFLGWVRLAQETPASLLDDINATAAGMRELCDVVVAIGIGGSYLGAKAVIEALGNSFAAYRNEGVQVLFAGQNIGEDYLAELQDYLAGKRFGIIVISKSGTTTEPAIAFRLLKEQLEREVGRDEARKRIVAITDEKRGALRTPSQLRRLQDIHHPRQRRRPLLRTHPPWVCSP